MTKSSKDLYKEYVVPSLIKEFGYPNPEEVPKILKISVNRGLGEGSRNSKELDISLKEIATITGQQPVINKATKSIAGFKVRQGWPIGTKVTLRSDRMYEFLERLVGIAIPRIRDFRGISPKQFDGRGNFSMGVTEQIIFPEIDYEKIDKLRGLDITITTTARNDDEGRALLRAFNFPLKG